MTLIKTLREYATGVGRFYCAPAGDAMTAAADRLEAAEKLVEQLESDLKDIAQIGKEDKWKSETTEGRIAREALAAAKQFKSN